MSIHLSLDNQMIKKKILNFEMKNFIASGNIKELARNLTFMAI